MNKQIKLQEQYKRRVRRVRAKISGTAEKPRLTVTRSLRHVYVQLIDDAAQRTIAAVHDRDVKNPGKPVEVAKEVGKMIAAKAQAAGITTAVFDRHGFQYHGRVKAVAEGAREAGLSF